MNRQWTLVCWLLDFYYCCIFKNIWKYYQMLNILGLFQNKRNGYIISIYRYEFLFIDFLLLFPLRFFAKKIQKMLNNNINFNFTNCWYTSCLSIIFFYYRLCFKANVMPLFSVGCTTKIIYTRRYNQIFFV